MIQGYNGFMGLGWAEWAKIHYKDKHPEEIARRPTESTERAVPMTSNTNWDIIGRKEKKHKKKRKKSR